MKTPKKYGVLYSNPVIYFGRLRYPHKKFLPLLEVGKTRETELPFRRGRCLVFRAPWTEKSLYLGLWTSRPKVDPDDDDAIIDILLDAMNVTWQAKPQVLVEGEDFVKEERKVGETLFRKSSKKSKKDSNS